MANCISLHRSLKDSELTAHSQHKSWRTNRRLKKEYFSAAFPLCSFILKAFIAPIIQDNTHAGSEKKKFRFQKGRNISELACSTSGVVTSFRLACKLFCGKFLLPPRPRYSELFDSLREIIIKKRDINNSLCSVVHRNK